MTRTLRRDRLRRREHRRERARAGARTRARADSLAQRHRQGEAPRRVRGRAGGLHTGRTLAARRRARALDSRGTRRRRGEGAGTRAAAPRTRVRARAVGSGVPAARARVRARVRRAEVWRGRAVRGARGCRSIELGLRAGPGARGGLRVRGEAGRRGDANCAPTLPSDTMIWRRPRHSWNPRWMRAASVSWTRTSRNGTDPRARLLTRACLLIQPRSVPPP
jgi:hypothetical protein